MGNPKTGMNAVEFVTVFDAVLAGSASAFGTTRTDDVGKRLIGFRIVALTGGLTFVMAADDGNGSIKDCDAVGTLDIFGVTKSSSSLSATGVFYLATTGGAQGVIIPCDWALHVTDVSTSSNTIKIQAILLKELAS